MSREAIAQRREELMRLLRVVTDELFVLAEIEAYDGVYEDEPSEEDWRSYVAAANAGAFDVGECAMCGGRCSSWRTFCCSCSEQHAEGGAR